MNPIFELDFWQGRLKEAQRINLPSHAIGMGFNFPLIDKIHKEIVAKEIKSDDKVLDAGCGYGRICEWFSPQQYVGIDFVPEFVHLAKEFHPTYMFHRMDIRESLRFAPKVFDWGICISMKEMIRRDAGQEEWDEIEKNLKVNCKKLLILEYGNSREEEIKKYEIL